MPEIPTPPPPPYESPESMLARTDWQTFGANSPASLTASLTVSRQFEVCYPAVLLAWFDLVTAEVAERTGSAQVEWGHVEDAHLFRRNERRFFVTAKGAAVDAAVDLFRRLGEEMEG